MNGFRALKYISVYTLPITVVIAFTQQGIWTFLPIVYAFGFIPLLELLIPPQEQNLTEMEESAVLHDPIYDWLLYLVVPVQYAILIWFFFVVGDEGLARYEHIGLITAMGLLCGALAINVAHELGHRQVPHERFLAKLLLFTSLYSHFYIEHNRGHHVRVATEEDPSSARYNEVVYVFWFRSVIQSYFSAWELEAKRLRIAGKPIVSIHNEMIVYSVLQLAALVVIGYFFGITVLLSFVAAATMGFLLLETVNYIEHYGLQRKQVKGKQRYERVQPAHSWNSNHVLGRLLLFELSRHSDHHFKADRKYPVLRHHTSSPQMPTGYPGMMVLSLVPPAFFKVVNPRVRKIQALQALG